MAIIPAARLMKVVLEYTMSGNRLSCGMYYGCDTTITIDDGQPLAAAWEAAMMLDLRPCVSLEVKFERISAHNVVPGTCMPGNIYKSGDVGTGADEALPSNVAAILQLRQSEVSSRHNGRIFLSGIQESDCVNGVITGGFIAGDGAALVAAMLTPIITTGPKSWRLCTVKRFDAGVSVTPEGYTVNTIAISPSMGTQRRRTTELREFHP